MIHRDASLASSNQPYAHLESADQSPQGGKTHGRIKSSFETGASLTKDDVFGILAVNGWHNVVYLVTGLLGLAAVGYAARTYALVLGLVYLVVAIWGFAETSGGFGVILDFLPVNTEDNVLHLVLGLTGLAAGAATRSAQTATA